VSFNFRTKFEGYSGLSSVALDAEKETLHRSIAWPAMMIILSKFSFRREQPDKVRTSALIRSVRLYIDSPAT